MNDHSSRPLQQRFNDNRGNGAGARGEQASQLVEAIDPSLVAGKSHWTAKAISGMDPMDRDAQACERRGEGGIRAHRHGADGVAVVSVLERHDFPFLRLSQVPPVLDRHLQGYFNRG